MLSSFSVNAKAYVATRFAKWFSGNDLLRSIGSFYPSPSIRADKYHLDLIVHLAQIIKPKKYLEVGTYRAGLFNLMIPIAEELIAVDINPDAKKYIRHSDKTIFFEMESRLFWNVAKVKNYRFDLIFIDGDHSKNAVREDFFGALSVINDEGIILLHDTYPVDSLATIQARCGDGYEAIWEISRAVSEYELVTIPVHPGLTIVRKRKGQVPWRDFQVDSPN